jgi:hypothetical protein
MTQVTNPWFFPTTSYFYVFLNLESFGEKAYFTHFGHHQ